MEEEMVCPVCLEYFEDPIILPCSHNICKGCARQWLRHGRGGDAPLRAPFSAHQIPGARFKGTRATVAISKITCPTCREEHILDERGLDAFPLNITLRNIVDRSAASSESESESVKCDLCEGVAKLATKACKECRLKYCEACLQECHLMRGALGTHHIMEASEFARKKSAPRCEKHGKKIEIYCSKCDVVICQLCNMVGDHKGHEVKDCPSVFGEKKAKMGLDVEKLKEIEKSLETRLRQVNQGMKNIKTTMCRYRDNVKKVCSDMVRQIQEREREILGEISQYELERMQIATDTKDKYSDALNNVADTRRAVEKALEEKETLSLLTQYREKSERAAKTMAQYNLPSVDTSQWARYEKNLMVTAQFDDFIKRFKLQKIESVEVENLVCLENRVLHWERPSNLPISLTIKYSVKDDKWDDPPKYVVTQEYPLPIDRIFRSYWITVKVLCDQPVQCDMKGESVFFKGISKGKKLYISKP